MDVKECEELVAGPGKFEGEARYVPYFFEAYLNGCADEEEGSILSFNVDASDVELFEELSGRDRVHLQVRDDGFVVEVEQLSDGSEFDDTDDEHVLN